jgi:hypothetical protein
MSQRSVVLVLGVSTAVVAIVPQACGGNSGALPSIADASADAVIDGTSAAPGTGSSGGSGTSEPVPTPHPTVNTTGGELGGGGSNATGGAAPTKSLLRLADWAPDAPAAGFDLCIAPHGARDATWTGPLLGSGVAFPAVGRYVEIAPGTYDARVIAATSGSCPPTVGTPLVLPALGANARATLAVIGDITPSGNDKQAEVVVFPDDSAGPSTQAAVRFIDATPGVSAVIFGTGTLHDLTFRALTSAVPFAGASSMPPDGGVSDSDGYVLVAPSTGVTLSAHVGDGEYDVSNSMSTSLVDGGFVNNGGGSNVFGSNNDMATGSNASWAAGGAYTVALVGGAFGGAPPELVLCADDAPAQGSLSACTTLAH